MAAHNTPQFEITLPVDADTRQAGQDISVVLFSPITVYLSGDLGAGKSELARAIIRNLVSDPNAEVPSPTFSLVQHYPVTIRGVASEILHADLYRTGDPGEVRELGLGEPTRDQVRLIEWPEKGGGELASADLVIHLETIANGDGSEGRRLIATGDEKLVAAIERSFSIRAFLDEYWQKGVKRQFLLGDASARSYEKAIAEGETRILMNAPRQPDGPPIRDGKPYSQIAHLAEDVSAFVGVAKILEQSSMRVPHLHGIDLEAGLLLCEDLGSDLIIDENRQPIDERYLAAGEMLAALHERPVICEAEITPDKMHRVPDYDRDALMIELELLTDWYLPALTGRETSQQDIAAYRAIWGRLIEHLAQAENHLVLRDFHSPNIIWQADASDHHRVGLIDFQDAMIGPCAYDLASLAQDARVDVSPELEAAIINAYVEKRKAAGSFDEAGFRCAYAIMAAQRSSKILGIFIRLDRRDGKPGYLKHLPRLEGYLQRSFTHPALYEYRSWFDAVTDATNGRENCHKGDIRTG